MAIYAPNYLFENRNPWARSAPTCVNGCHAYFVVCYDPGWWHCLSCRAIFPIKKFLTFRGEQ